MSSTRHRRVDARAPASVSCSGSRLNTARARSCGRRWRTIGLRGRLRVDDVRPGDVRGRAHHPHSGLSVPHQDQDHDACRCRPVCVVIPASARADRSSRTVWPHADASCSRCWRRPRCRGPRPRRVHELDNFVHAEKQEFSIRAALSAHAQSDPIAAQRHEPLQVITQRRLCRCGKTTHPIQGA